MLCLGRQPPKRAATRGVQPQARQTGVARLASCLRTGVLTTRLHELARAKPAKPAKPAAKDRRVFSFATASSEDMPPPSACPPSPLPRSTPPLPERHVMAGFIVDRMTQLIHKELGIQPRHEEPASEEDDATFYSCVSPPCAFSRASSPCRSPRPTTPKPATQGDYPMQHPPMVGCASPRAQGLSLLQHEGLQEDEEGASSVAEPLPHMPTDVPPTSSDLPGGYRDCATPRMAALQAYTLRLQGGGVLTREERLHAARLVVDKFTEADTDKGERGMAITSKDKDKKGQRIGTPVKRRRGGEGPSRSAMAGARAGELLGRIHAALQSHRVIMRRTSAQQGGSKAAEKANTTHTPWYKKQTQLRASQSRSPREGRSEERGQGWRSLNTVFQVAACSPLKGRARRRSSCSLSLLCTPRTVSSAPLNIITPGPMATTVTAATMQEAKGGPFPSSLVPLETLTKQYEMEEQEDDDDGELDLSAISQHARQPSLDGPFPFPFPEQHEEGGAQEDEEKEDREQGEDEEEEYKEEQQQVMTPSPLPPMAEQCQPYKPPTPSAPLAPIEQAVALPSPTPSPTPTSIPTAPTAPLCTEETVPAPAPQQEHETITAITITIPSANPVPKEENEAPLLLPLPSTRHPSAKIKALQDKITKQPSGVSPSTTKPKDPLTASRALKLKALGTGQGQGQGSMDQLRAAQRSRNLRSTSIDADDAAGAAKPTPLPTVTVGGTTVGASSVEASEEEGGRGGVPGSVRRMAAEDSIFSKMLSKKQTDGRPSTPPTDSNTAAPSEEPLKEEGGCVRRLPPNPELFMKMLAQRQAKGRPTSPPTDGSAAVPKAEAEAEAEATSRRPPPPFLGELLNSSPLRHTTSLPTPTQQEEEEEGAAPGAAVGPRPPVLDSKALATRIQGLRKTGSLPNYSERRQQEAPKLTAMQEFMAKAQARAQAQAAAAEKNPQQEAVDESEWD